MTDIPLKAFGLLDDEQKQALSIKEIADEMFPIERQEEEGWPIGFCLEDLGRSVQLWFHANGDSIATVGQAAATFNVSPTKVLEAVGTTGIFLWINLRPDIAASTFDVDGY